MSMCFCLSDIVLYELWCISVHQNVHGCRRVVPWLLHCQQNSPESCLLHSWIISFTSAKLPCQRLISSIIHSQLSRNPMGRECSKSIWLLVNVTQFDMKGPSYNSSSDVLDSCFYPFVISYYWINTIAYVCNAKGSVFQRCAWSIGRRWKLKWSCCLWECDATYSFKPCGCLRGTFCLCRRSRWLALLSWLLKQQVSVKCRYASERLQSIPFQIQPSPKLPL